MARIPGEPTTIPKEEPSGRASGYGLTGLVLLALGLRLLAAGWGGPITPDGVYYYLPSALGLFEGDLERGSPPTHHPGTPP